MKSILLFPGAFNPPHLGHAKSVELALQARIFDEVWIMPSGKRVDKAIETTYEDRREMGKIFTAYVESLIDVPVRLITTELDEKDGRYTSELLKEIKSQPGAMVTQLIGLDGYLNLRPREDEHFIIIKRPGYELPSDFSLKSDCSLLEEVGEDISSTHIRNLIKVKDASYRQFVPPAIVDYIDKKQLYR